MGEKQIGSISWTDLTVPDAENIKDFYESVVGWQARPHEMQGDYHDFDIFKPSSDECVAGICHTKGFNADMPAQWLIYITVEDVEASAKRCVELGGKIITGPKKMGNYLFCVIQDPAGAVSALIA